MGVDPANALNVQTVRFDQVQDFRMFCNGDGRQGLHPESRADSPSSRTPARQ
jgi:hypothetical protein